MAEEETAPASETTDPGTEPSHLDPQKSRPDLPSKDYRPYPLGGSNRKNFGSDAF
jgi:hypothetical protein